ncbi:endoribonuclease MazF [Candidatus Kapaibacterium sp.]
MNNPPYIPDRGDIVWLDFNPQAGHEQKGRRPAIILSPKSYNEKTNLALVCPITTQIKNYPFEVKLNEYLTTKGVVISDQIKSLDWKCRNVEFIEKVDRDIINNVISKSILLLK